MGAPGHTVTIGERPAAAAAAPSTANGFMVGICERGSVTAPVLVVSLADAVQKLGDRVTGYPRLYDSLDLAFREGASSIYVGRAVGEGAKASSGELVDGAGKKVLKIAAKSPGVWGDTVKVATTLAGELLSIEISLGSTVVESVTGLASNAEAIAWATANSAYITLEAGEAGTIAKTQSVTLTGGKDENAKVETKQIEEALALFGRDLGPGQVAVPGFTTEAVQKALLAHAAANNRRALVDDQDTGTVATLIADAAKLRSLPEHQARFGGMFAPWIVIPGLTVGTTRIVPPSALVMGLIARAEAQGFNPNQAAAGTQRGSSSYATELTQHFTDAQRAEMNDGGVNASILIRGVVTNYGNRTLANPSTDGNWKSFSASRLVMAVAAAAGLVLESYDFAQIDGHGYVFKALEGDLSGSACIPFYLSNALFGTTPAEAFSVNTGPDVNTPATIAAEEIKAQIAIRVSPTGEMLSVEIVKVPTTETL